MKTNQMLRKVRNLCIDITKERLIDPEDLTKSDTTSLSKLVQRVEEIV